MWKITVLQHHEILGTGNRQIHEHMCCSLDLRAIANKSYPYIYTYCLAYRYRRSTRISVRIRCRSSRKLLPHRTFEARSILNCNAMSTNKSITVCLFARQLNISELLKFSWRSWKKVERSSSLLFALSIYKYIHL